VCKGGRQVEERIGREEGTRGQTGGESLGCLLIISDRRMMNEGGKKKVSNE
jgi:hypothetical protein